MSDDQYAITSDPRDVDEPDVHSAQRKKRKASTSPTQRTLAWYRKVGYTAQVVERYNPHARVLVDLFGVIDIVAIKPAAHGGPGEIVGVQACAATDHARRRDKIVAEPRAQQWVEAGGKLVLCSWGKRGDRGARKLWTPRFEAFTAESWSEARDR